MPYGIITRAYMSGDKMLFFKSQKHVFWQALFVTIVIFSLGILMGMILENWRYAKVRDIYQKSEIDLLDVKLQSEIYSLGEFDCESAVSENIDFADRIFEEASLLERYEKASRLTDDIIRQHKKYDLLRATLLLNSIRIKEKCGSSYYDVIYFYNYNNPDIELRARQSVFSKLLSGAKDYKGNEILLIPMAADNNITAIDLLLDRYEVSLDELPVVIIDGKKEERVIELESLEEFLMHFD
jgi:hypothetical protein